ncbi:MAG: glycoside hydrolase family 3 C-terminal domain-containing protein [Terriglobales bacterium]
MIRHNVPLSIASLCLALSVTASAQNTNGNYDKRARDIVRHMTLDEKISELHGIRDDAQGIYRYVPPVPRLKIPALRITNGPAGAGPGGTRAPRPQAPATALPSPISLASSWDRALSREYGVIAGAESKDLGNGLLEAPDINIARVPQNGRTFEGYGEDPYLAGELSVANIEGIQSQGIIANVKHYVANNQETDRFIVNEDIDERTLREIYLPAFEESIRKGRSASLMCAYPKINGTFNCENDLLLNKILKKEWGFQGFVTSDFGAVHSTVPSAMAGLDLELPTGKYFGDDLKAAVQSGEVPMKVIDDKLVRRFRTMMELGVFDTPPQPQPIPEKEDGAKSRTMAEQGMVLLKNSGNLLPLNREQLKSIAVIGPTAANAITGGGGSSHVVPLYTVTPVQGMRNRADSSVNVTFANGSDVAQAVSMAKAADVAIVMVGMVDREGSDHPLVLGDEQDNLVAAVAQANPRTVVVLKTGSAVLMPWIEQVPAVLEAWYPGEEDGNAVADVLFGEANPSGKLPVTFPRSLDDLAANTPAQYPGVDGVAHYSEGVFVGYRHFDAKNITPLFPFGFGLSYTTFAFENLKLSTSSVSAKHPGTVTVEADVRNTGKVTGAEVAQLYVAIPATTVPQPPRQLKGFEKVEIQSGQTAHVSFSLDGLSLSYWDVKSHGWKVAPGKYGVYIGSSSRELPLHSELEVK